MIPGIPEMPCVATIIGKHGRKHIKNCGKCVGHKEISRAILELLHDPDVNNIRLVKPEYCKGEKDE